MRPLDVSTDGYLRGVLSVTSRGYLGYLGQVVEVGRKVVSFVVRYISGPTNIKQTFRHNKIKQVARPISIIRSVFKRR